MLKATDKTFTSQYFNLITLIKVVGGLKTILQPVREKNTD